MLKYKITHVEGVTEFEGVTVSGGAVVEFDEVPMDLVETLYYQNAQAPTLLLLEKDPKYTVPVSRFVQSTDMVSTLATITNPWVAFQPAPFAGFYMIEKGN